MNRFAFILAAVVCMVALAEVALGCKNVPSCDVIYMVAHAGGTGTALVMNETSLDTEKRTIIRDITKEVRECTPEVGQTLEAAWTPIAQAHTDLLVQEGKIDAAAGVVIMAGFKTVMVGNKPGTVGVPLQGTQFRVVDPDTMEELPLGEDGLLLVGGAQIMKGYLKDPERTEKSIAVIDGKRWYKTGDKGHIDEDGFITIVDRYSRFAKLGGEMISLIAVEQRLHEMMHHVGRDHAHFRFFLRQRIIQRNCYPEMLHSSSFCISGGC